MVYRAMISRRIWFLLLPLALMFSGPYVTWLLLNLFEATGGNNLPALPGALLAVMTFPFVTFTFVNVLLLGQPQTYLVVSLLSGLLCLLVVVRYRRGNRARLVAGMTLLLVLVMPVVFRSSPQFAYLEDRGFVIHDVPTQQTALDSAVEGLVGLLDMKACQYEILGWSVENVLYYRSDCAIGVDTFWRYNPQHPGEVQQVGPAAGEPVTDAETLLLHPDYSPTDHRSPNGEWIASVWGKHHYGPENVIVVTGPA